MKGWNWTPIDPLYGVPRPEKLERLLPPCAPRERQSPAGVGWGADRDRAVLRALRPVGAPGLAGVQPVELRSRERPRRRRRVRAADGRRGALDRPAEAAPPLARDLVRRQRARRRRLAPRCSRRSGTSSGSSIPARVAADLAASATTCTAPGSTRGFRAHYERYDAATAKLYSEFGVEGMTICRALESPVDAEHRWPADRSNPVYEHLGAWWSNAPLVQRCFGGRIARPRDDAPREPVAPIRRVSLRGRSPLRRGCGTVPWQFTESFPNAWCTSALDWHGRPKPRTGASPVRIAPEPVRPVRHLRVGR